MTQTPEPEPTASVDDGPAPSVYAAPSENVSSPVDDVLAQVKERGFITTGEIFAAFPDLEPDADELRDLWEMFESRGIKVLDEIAEELQLEDQRRAGAQQSAAPSAEPRRRAEHRPSATSRPGGPASRRPATDEPDEELQALRSAQRATHT